LCDYFTWLIIESIGPDIDAWLFEFILNHVFSAKGFYEKRDGGIRITLELAPLFAEIVSLWSEKIDSIIEQVKSVLLKYHNPEFKTTLKKSEINIITDLICGYYLKLLQLSLCW